MPRTKKVETTDEAKQVTVKKAVRKTAAKKKATPSLARNEFGLIDSIDYKFFEDGFIDWKSTVPKGHLFPNKERFKAFKKDIPKDVESIDDDMLIVKLSGLRWAAKVRGYKAVTFETCFPESNKCVSKCTISWIGNYETGGSEVVYEGVASATLQNCDGFARAYLESIACNRAFARCVRSFLNINIVCDEELGGKLIPDEEKEPTKNEESLVSISPQAILAKAIKKKFGSLDEAVQFANQEEAIDTDGVDSFETLSERIDVKMSRKLLAKINKM